MGDNDTGHLKGMSNFVHSLSPQPGTVAAASFWVGLRQNIYVAVRKKQQVAINLVNSLVDRSLEGTDDCSWANRAVVHCADVLNFCYGPGRTSEGGQADLERLMRLNKDWGNCRPNSFDPVYKQDTDSVPFPEILYHRSCQGK